MHPNVARVLAAARGAGLELEIERFPEGTRTADDAARAVGCEVGQIVKSLVFVADASPVLALVSGANGVDRAALATVVGAEAVRRADGDEARAATGFAIGGVPPFGQERQLPVIVDALLGYLLFRSRLVPRVLAIVALVGAPLLLVNDLAIFFGAYAKGSALDGVATLPIAAFELGVGGLLRESRRTTKARRHEEGKEKKSLSHG